MVLPEYQKSLCHCLIAGTSHMGSVWLVFLFSLPLPVCPTPILGHCLFCLTPLTKALHSLLRYLWIIIFLYWLLKISMICALLNPIFYPSLSCELPFPCPSALALLICGHSTTIPTSVICIIKFSIATNTLLLSVLSNANQSSIVS